MNRVITINLNGNAFALEEPGYDVLHAYLERANSQLAGNPDKDEILADLEQAIAEKCAFYLRPHKTVVLTAEIEQVVQDMGPVESAPPDGGDAAAGPSANAAGAGDPGSRSGAANAPPKRLYQIREGAKISGVCMGLAAYFDIDVTIVRIAFVLLTLLTSGGLLIAYIVMMFVIPVANTTEERAAARGVPFNAQELIDRAKQQYSEIKERFKDDKGEWRQHWRKQRAQWRQQSQDSWRRWRNDTRWREESAQHGAASLAQGPSYSARIFTGIVVSLLGIVSAFFLLGLLLLVISLATTSALFGWPLPAGVPLWLGVVLLILIYSFFVWPLHALRRASWRGTGETNYAWFAAWDFALRAGIVFLALWYGYEHIPQVHDFVNHLPQIWENLWRSVTTPYNVTSFT